MTLEDIFKEEDGHNITPKKQVNNSEDALEKTLDINTLDLNTYLDEPDIIAKPVEKSLEEEPKEEKKPKKQDNTIQEAFTNCSVLAFITAFMGAGWLINIINQI